MEYKAKELVPYHPGLPSTQQANSDEGRKLVFSDHIAIVATTAGKIKVVSFNATQSGKAGCGFAPETWEHSDYEETQEQEQERHLRIVSSLEKAAQKQQMDFLALQEVSLQDPALCKMIVASLGEYGYQIVKKDADIANGWGMGQGIILYSPKFVLEVDEELGTNQFTQRGLLPGVKATFKYKSVDGEEKITLLSTHGAFKFTPELHEQEIEKFIVAYSKIGKVLVVGDFNCSVAPFHSHPQIIVTSVSPPLVNAENIQGSAFIDGVFYFDPAEGVCCQLEINHLNPNSGEIYQQEELTPINNLPDAQASIANSARMIICVDHRYKTEKLVMNKTIFEYQEMLQKELSTPTILVRSAATSHNLKGISVCLPKNIYILAQKVNPNLVYYTANDFITKKPSHYFVCGFDVKELVETMDQVIKLAHFLTPEELAFRSAIKHEIVTKILQLSQKDSDLTEDEKIIVENLSEIRNTMAINPECLVSDLLKKAIDSLSPSKKMNLEGSKQGTTRNIITLQNESSTKLILKFLGDLLKTATAHETKDEVKKDNCNIQ